jgi:hypothetical protein
MWFSRLPRPVRFLVMAIMAVVFLALFGFIVMWLWNALMPPLFHLPVLTYWQAVGLLILAKIFFGGFRGGHPGGRRYIRERWAARYWEKMSEEERAKFRAGMRDWCGFTEPPKPSA